MEAFTAAYPGLLPPPMMQFKVAYLRRYERVIAAATLEAAGEHMQRIASLYPYEDFRLLSIYDVALLPTYADAVLAGASKEGVDMLPVML